jgi:hypothetical protein
MTHLTKFLYSITGVEQNYLRIYRPALPNSWQWNLVTRKYLRVARYRETHLKQFNFRAAGSITDSNI